MKKIIIALIIGIMATTAAAQSEFFNRCERLDGVTSVYISKTMLQFAGTSSIDCENVDISDMASKLDGIEIINAEGANCKKVKELISSCLNNKGCESLMRVKENDETVNMYLRRLPKGRSEFIILAEEAKEISVIILTGTLTMDDVVKAVKK